MDYKLAKMLRDAGFPLNIATTGGEYFQDGESRQRYLYPTLEELIEACGDIHFELYRTKPIPGYAFLGNYFISTNQNEVPLPDPRPVFHSETPGECFAHLWLAINKK